MPHYNRFYDLNKLVSNTDTYLKTIKFPKLKLEVAVEPLMVVDTDKKVHTEFTWYEAVDMAEDTGWRLPTTRECPAIAFELTKRYNTDWNGDPAEWADETLGHIGLGQVNFIWTNDLNKDGEAYAWFVLSRNWRKPTISMRSNIKNKVMLVRDLKKHD